MPIQFHRNEWTVIIHSSATVIQFSIQQFFKRTYALNKWAPLPMGNISITTYYSRRNSVLYIVVWCCTIHCISRYCVYSVVSRGRWRSLVDRRSHCAVSSPSCAPLIRRVNCTASIGIKPVRVFGEPRSQSTSTSFRKLGPLGRAYSIWQFSTVFTVTRPLTLCCLHSSSGDICSAMLQLCKLCLMLGLCDYAKKQCWHNRAAPITPCEAAYVIFCPSWLSCRGVRD